MRVLLLDHEDSFVYNIAQALSAAGAEVVTLRATRPSSELRRVDPDAIVLSPARGIRATGGSPAALGSC